MPPTSQHGKRSPLLALPPGLLILSAILGQIDLVASKILTPLGLAQRTTNVALFATLALTAVIAVIRYVRAWYIEHRVAALCTTGTLRRFALRMQEQTDNEKDIEFTESDALAFVHVELRLGRGLKRVVIQSGLGTVGESTTNLLKDLMIAHMFSFGLIEAGPPHNLERVFRMKKRPRYVSWEEHKAMLTTKDDDDNETEKV